MREHFRYSGLIGAKSPKFKFVREAIRTSFVDREELKCSYSRRERVMAAFSTILQHQQKHTLNILVSSTSMSKLQACSRGGFNHFVQQQLQRDQTAIGLRLSSPQLPRKIMRRRSTITGAGGGGGGALSTICSSETIRWVSSISAAALMYAKRAAIMKPLLVPLLALSLPRDLITWMRGDYGQWTAFLALGARLFYFIPGELELPLMLLLAVLIAPPQVMNQRAAHAGLVIWTALASYIGYQHFSYVGGPGRAIQQRHIIPSVASACLVASPLVLLYRGY